MNRDDLRALVMQRFGRSTELPTRFFEEQADTISRACLAMAERFERGGRLLVLGAGAAATDAQHVSVEFVHPVLVGKRALPAVALTTDVAALTGGPPREGSVGVDFAGVLTTLGRSSDIALAMAHGEMPLSVRRALAGAREMGMLSIALGVENAISADGADFVFVAPAGEPLVAQEIHETLYHVLWELVHVFFERGSPAKGAGGCDRDPGDCSVCGDEAEPGVVVASNEASGTASISLQGDVRTVAIDLLGQVAVGDTVLVHQGFAISRVEGS